MDGISGNLLSECHFSCECAYAHDENALPEAVAVKSQLPTGNRWCWHNATVHTEYLGCSAFGNASEESSSGLQHALDACILTGS